MRGKRRALFLALLFLGVLLASGCASVRSYERGNEGPSPPSGSESRPRSKPYTIRGTTYYPYETADGFSQTGMASWYGPSFHGKKTANGERFNTNALTAAHKELPFNTMVKVTNLANGRSTTVRINDRGPFAKNRIIDLSKKAAQEIGMIQSGTARVRIEALDASGRAQTRRASNQSESARRAVETLEKVNASMDRLEQMGRALARIYIQVGAFSSPANSRQAAEALKNLGISGRVRSSGKVQIVQAGPFRTRQEAQDAMRRLAARFRGMFILED